MPEQNNDKLEDEVAAETVWNQSRQAEASIIVDLFRVRLLTISVLFHITERHRAASYVLMSVALCGCFGAVLSCLCSCMCFCT